MSNTAAKHTRKTGPKNHPVYNNSRDESPAGQKPTLAGGLQGSEPCSPTCGQCHRRVSSQQHQHNAQSHYRRGAWSAKSAGFARHKLHSKQPFAATPLLAASLFIDPRQQQPSSISGGCLADPAYAIPFGLIPSSTLAILHHCGSSSNWLPQSSSIATTVMLSLLPFCMAACITASAAALARALPTLVRDRACKQETSGTHIRSIICHTRSCIKGPGSKRLAAVSWPYPVPPAASWA